MCSGVILRLLLFDNLVFDPIHMLMATAMLGGGMIPLFAMSWVMAIAAPDHIRKPFRPLPPTAVTTQGRSVCAAGTTFPRYELCFPQGKISHVRAKTHHIDNRLTFECEILCMLSTSYLNILSDRLDTEKDPVQ